MRTQAMTPVERAARIAALHATWADAGVPFGFCQCGCGALTSIAKETIRRKGYVKGEPYRLVQGHGSYLTPAVKETRLAALRQSFEDAGVPYGFCQCGCGRHTQIAPATKPNVCVEGEPQRTCLGHHLTPPYFVVVLWPSGELCLPLVGRTGIRGWTVIDSVDALQAKHRWTYAARRRERGTSYASRVVRGGPLKLHNAIMYPPAGMEVDHINGDGLDNRRANLRVVSKSTNSQNRLPRLGCASKYPGVSWQGGLWKARATERGREFSLGSYATEMEAWAVARAYREEHYEGFVPERIDAYLATMDAS